MRATCGRSDIPSQKKKSYECRSIKIQHLKQLDVMRARLENLTRLLRAEAFLTVGDC